MFADRTSTVKPFLAFEVYERAVKLARAGRSIIHLEVGEPDFDTPACVNEAAKKALDEGHTHYVGSLGDLQLREELVAWYAKRYGVSLSADQILLFSGSSPGIFLLFSALLNAGDEVILSDPCYPCYPNFIRFPGGVPNFVPTLESDGFRYEPSDVAKHISPRTKAILINSPCNPTGILLEPERMQALADLGKLIVSDEIYHGLTYGGSPEHSILEFTDNAVVINGFSKLFAMTGWRLGYLIVPKHMVETLRILSQNFFISGAAMIQRAGIAALSPDAEQDVERMRTMYDERRKMLIQGLRDLGFGIAVEPMGAFYVLANARHLGSNSLELAFDILDKVGIGATPGIDFGNQSEGFLRFSYANSKENIQEALRRLHAYTDMQKAR